jgi:hypothetical protein
VAKPTAEKASARDNPTIEAQDWLEQRDAKRKTPMTRTTDSQDRTFPYVLVCSTFTTIVSLASVWIATAASYAPMMVA